MLLFNLIYLLVDLSHNTFTFIYQFLFATGHNLFKSIKKHSSFAGLYVFPMLQWPSVKRVPANFAKFTENT